MKGMIIGIALLALVGCGKTVTALKTNGDAAVDNTTVAVTQTVGIVSGVVKKLIGIGTAVYEIGTKALEDLKDNAVTTKDAVVGVVTTK